MIAAKKIASVRPGPLTGVPAGNGLPLTKVNGGGGKSHFSLNHNPITPAFSVAGQPETSAPASCRTIPIREYHPVSRHTFLSLRNLRPVSGRVSAFAGDSPAIVGELPAVTGEAPAIMGEVPAVVGEVPAITGELPAIVGEVPAVTGESPAFAGDLPAGRIPSRDLGRGHPVFTGILSSLSSLSILRNLRNLRNLHSFNIQLL